MTQNNLSRDAAAQLWSSLPNDILSIIIDCLDIPPDQYVITISPTTFDIKFCKWAADYGRDGELADRYWKTFDQMFNFFVSPSIKTFKLELPDSIYSFPIFYSTQVRNNDIIASWADRLRCYNINHFKVISSDGRSETLNRLISVVVVLNMPSVFRMCSLVSLELDLCIFERGWSIPDFVNFPILKKLNLIFDNYECLERLLDTSCCPLLEDLSFTIKGVITDNSNRTHLCRDGSISILSRNLKRLCICMLYKFGNLDVLIDAPNLVHFKFVAPYIFELDSGKYTLMLDSISHVRSLVLDEFAQLSLGDSPCKTIFSNVTHLTLDSRSDISWGDLCFMLQSCPNLEVLVLEQEYSSYWVCFTPEDILMPLEHVKRIQLVHMNFINLCERFLSLAKCLLRSAPLLEKLTLTANVLYGTNADFFRPLLECPRRSQECKIEFLGAYQKLFLQQP